MFVIQIYEWIAMINVVAYQKNKKNGEILFDNFNHDAQTIKFFEKTGTFKSKSRKREIWLQRGLLSFSILKIVYALFISITEFACTNMVDLPNLYATLTIYVSMFNLSMKFLVFCCLMCYLKAE